MTTIADRLREARERAGYAVATDAARRFGWATPTYLAHENGSRGIKPEKAREYARAFRVSAEWLLLGIGEKTKKLVPFVGYVGAGAEVFAIDDGGCLDEIDPPPGIGPEAVAVGVKGDSMFPRYMAGDILIYDQQTTPVRADGQECIVSLPDGRKFVKIVRAERDGTATLESFNAPPMRNLIVEWVAPILWVKRSNSN
ncbi:XRE family transcriptional regulator [Sinirhodobacter huangdaonensis]|uniref:XRE family transcriptional regulator n=1 Tax=Paenirhodobacter huangdaonensis TaxID=2501515 RepID=A0A443M0J9_9RHOB|nr:XRE family transcriptional regulator [Sinirhodobacter huangdaonensis]RWR54902.1 XRE family transcriptional regulator [Sinirhodobacter huangdaonensis]